MVSPVSMNSPVSEVATASSAERKTHTVARRSFAEVAGDTAKGFWNSKIVRGIILPAALLAACLFVFHPAIWVAAAIAAVVAAGSVIYLLTQRQKTSFEVVGVARLASSRNYNEIALPPEAQWSGKLFLGALPNELDIQKMGELTHNEKELAVLSLNEDWELMPRFFSHPVRNDRWAAHKHIWAKDHKLLPLETMDRAADWIHEQAQMGRNVYVHCRAGVGRSATAIAASLMKHTDLAVEDICASIKASRKKSSIWDKVGALRQYNEEKLGGRSDMSPEMHYIADALDALHSTEPKIRNIPDKETRRRCEGYINAMMAARGHKPVFKG